METLVLARRRGQEIELSYAIGGLFEVERQPAADAYTLNTIRALSQEFVERTTGRHAEAWECTQDESAQFRTRVTID